MIFVDTGAFVARFLERDQFHKAARSCWRKLAKQPTRCFTSNLVLSETFTLLGRRASYSFACERARGLVTSKALTILRPDTEDDLRALDLFEKLADQRVSFTDCVSFQLMRRARIERAFTFDRHFRDAGFEIWPRP